MVLRCFAATQKPAAQSTWQAAMRALWSRPFQRWNHFARRLLPLAAVPSGAFRLSPRPAIFGGFGGRNGCTQLRIGADKFGFKGLKAVHWNLTETRALRACASSGVKLRWSRGARCGRDRRAYRPQSQGQVRRVRFQHRKDGVVGKKRQAHAGASSTSCSTTSSRTQRAGSCSPRTSTVAPMPSTASRRASTPSLPGTRCSSARC